MQIFALVVVLACVGLVASVQQGTCQHNPVRDRYFCSCSCTSHDSLKYLNTGLFPHPRVCKDQTLERHRFLCSYWDSFFDEAHPPKRILHIAAEPALLRYLRGRFPCADIVTGNKNVEGSWAPSGRNKEVDVDVEAIQFPDNFFDVVVCNHVMEHVPNDTLALSEFHRVLRPGGTGFLLVPIFLEEGYKEDLSDNLSGEERRQQFGQEDHLRAYSPAEYERRLQSVGFKAESGRMSQWYAEHLPQLGRTAKNHEFTAEHREVYTIAHKPAQRPKP